MTVALRSPRLVSALIPVDNAPLRSSLPSDFAKYVRSMQEVESAKVTKTSDADKILQKYEEVSTQKKRKEKREKTAEKQSGGNKIRHRSQNKILESTTGKRQKKNSTSRIVST